MQIELAAPVSTESNGRAIDGEIRGSRADRLPHRSRPERANGRRSPVQRIVNVQEQCKPVYRRQYRRRKRRGQQLLAELQQTERLRFQNSTKASVRSLNRNRRGCFIAAIRSLRATPSRRVPWRSLSLKIDEDLRAKTPARLGRLDHPATPMARGA